MCIPVEVYPGTDPILFKMSTFLSQLVCYCSQLLANLRPRSLLGLKHSSIPQMRSGREWYGAFPGCGPLAEDSAAKLKRSQLNVCTVYVYCVRYTLFPSAAEICARLAGNFRPKLTTVQSGANDMVWLNVFYFTAS
jgi:hypothetical protein